MKAASGTWCDSLDSCGTQVLHRCAFLLAGGARARPAGEVLSLEMPKNASRRHI
jgi:hypothetical protein